ncbi:MAG: sensor histidine kinase [Anaerolineales bacterium]|nr:sensor histidine kinase [Anaerolineales bacterium]
MESNQNNRDVSTYSLYIFITALLGYLAILTATYLFQIGDVFFTSLLLAVCILHIGLYWINSRISKSKRWWIFYYITQALLIIAIAIITRGIFDINISLFESVIICIVGETLGWWGNSRKSFFIGGFFTLLAFVLIFLLNERENLIPSLSGLFINGGAIMLIMILFNQQIAEREKAMDLAESLESANAKLAAYNAKIESLTLQNERQRMARELHDTLAQGVAGLVLQLEAVKAHLSSDRKERASSIVEQALLRARATLSESRAAIDDLRSASGNLSELIQEKVNRFTQATGIPCDLEISITENQFSNEVTNHAVSILNESLANITKHAQAKNVKVKFVIQKEKLELEIQDDGKGFDVTQESSGHYGLLGIRERARLSNGKLEIQSNQNGTRILFSIEGAK